MDNYIYFSFARRDQANALIIAEQMKNDGYNVCYKEDHLDQKETRLLEQKLQAAFCIIYLTDNYLSTNMDTLSYLQEIEKPMLFITEATVPEIIFADPYRTVRRINKTDFSNTYELVAEICKDEIIKTCLINTDHKKTIFDGNSCSNIRPKTKFRSLTAMPKEMVHAQCPMIESLQEVKEAYLLESECVKQRLSKSYTDLYSDYELLQEQLKKETLENDSLQKKIAFNESNISQYDDMKAKLNQLNWNSMEQITEFKNWLYQEGILEYTPDKSLKAGDLIQFGSYPQDGSTPQPIIWDVVHVKNGKALLLSNSCLTMQPYHTTPYPVSWANCNLRQWLNTDFYHQAFTKEEKMAIRKSPLHTPKNERYGTMGGEDTNDYIFCLSLPEVEKYMETTEMKQKKASANVFRQNPWTRELVQMTDENNRSVRRMKDFKDTVVWWLRSSGRTNNMSATVNPSGNLNVEGTSVDAESICVCPAMIVYIEQLPSKQKA